MGNQSYAKDGNREQIIQIHQLQATFDGMITEKSALSETKAALTVQISRLFSELADLRSQHAMDKKNKQIAFMRMTVKAENNLKSVNKYQKKCLTMIIEKLNIINLLKTHV